jgi:hypothetical protein
MINNLLQITSQDGMESAFVWFDKVTLKFLVRFMINIVSVFILIRFIYYKNYRRTDLFLTFFGFNVIIFFITYLLNKVEMSMGAAFGLFAVFSMLRYRTEGISTKDMTYLFLVIAIGLITAVSKGSWDDLSIICILMLICIALLEGPWLIKKEVTKQLIYDKIELIHTNKYEELLEDVRSRLGLPVHRIEINEIDFIKDCAIITLYYYHKH